MRNADIRQQKRKTSVRTLNDGMRTRYACFSSREHPKKDINDTLEEIKDNNSCFKLGIFLLGGAPTALCAKRCLRTMGRVRINLQQVYAIPNLSFTYWADLSYAHAVLTFGFLRRAPRTLQVTPGTQQFLLHQHPSFHASAHAQK